MTTLTLIAFWQSQKMVILSSPLVGPFKNKFAISTDNKTEPEPTLSSPLKIKPLKPGEQSYILSHNQDVIGPNMTMVTLDPHDPTIGQTQTITATIKHSSPVTSATVKVISDNDQEAEEKLTLIEGDSMDGIWQATLETTDSRNYQYSIYFELLSSEGDWKDSIVLR